MPTQAAIQGLQILKKYNDLVEALQNFNSWGKRVQDLALILQNDSNYSSLLTAGERTALTNFLNSINSIIPISNIPNQVS